MDKKPQFQLYSDTVNNQLDIIERKFEQARALVEFARTWDDENQMFYAYLVQSLANTNHVIMAARGNLERLTALANPGEMEDLPF